MKSNSPHELISSTALLVAEGRALSDIPYAKEIYEELLALSLTPPDIKEGYNLSFIGFEARYKLLNKIIQERDVTQVLDLAAGFAPRGLDLTRDQKIKVLEIDLADVANSKRKIAARILQKTGELRPNLKIFEGNVISLEDIMGTINFFDPTKPVGIICEGLLRYLTPDERTTVAKNVRMILKKFGGFWATSDIFFQTMITDDIHRRNALVSKLTGRDVEAGRFKDTTEAKSYFENLGFAVEMRPMTEVAGDLVSAGIMGVPKEEEEDDISDRVVFIMEVTHS